jgi:hypothetical protein
MFDSEKDDDFFNFEKHEEMTTKQATILFLIFVGIGLVNYFWG